MKPKFPSSLQPIPKSAKRVFKGVVFEVWQWEQTMFDGSKKVFEKVKRSGSVGILSVMTNGKIVVTMQDQPSMKSFTGLVGGVIDAGESPEKTAERELLEEAGLKAQKIDFWYSLQPVTKVEWPIYIFIARGCERVAEQNLDSGEKIKLKFADWDEFLDLIIQDNFRDREIAFRFLKAMRDESKLEKLKEFILQSSF